MPSSNTSWPLATAGTLSAAAYYLLAFQVRATSDAPGITQYLVLLLLLFLSYGAVVYQHWGVPLLSRRTAQTVFCWALLFRVLLLGAGLEHGNKTDGLRKDLAGGETGYETFLLYDNDLWRYQWDGAVLAKGLSPYAATPSQLEALYLDAEDAGPAVDSLFEDDRLIEVYDNLSFTDHGTVYGPLAQWIFSLSPRLTSGSVFALKVLLILFDLATCLLVLALANRFGRPEAFVIYAWNPLVIKEIAGSGHVDSVMVFFVVLAVWLALDRRHAWSLSALALGSLVKFVPVVLFPLFLVKVPTRTWARNLLPAVAIVSLGFLPFRRDLLPWADGLRTFLSDWAFNTGPYHLLAWIIESANGSLSPVDSWQMAAWPSRLLIGGILAACCYWARRGARLSDVLFIALSTTVWLSPTVNPWYLIWALPFAALLRFWPWLFFMGLSQLSYVFYLDQIERTWLMWLEHGLFAALVVLWLHQQRSAKRGGKKKGRGKEARKEQTKRTRIERTA